VVAAALGSAAVQVNKFLHGMAVVLLVPPAASDQQGLLLASMSIGMPLVAL
jgi:hypothetical protein